MKIYLEKSVTIRPQTGQISEEVLVKLSQIVSTFAFVRYFNFDWNTLLEPSLLLRFREGFSGVHAAGRGRGIRCQWN